MSRALSERNQIGFIGSIDVPNQQVPGHFRLPPLWSQNVYFIQGHPNGNIKIGWAANPYLRLTKLQLSCPIPLVLLAFQEGGQQLEASYHKRFCAYRLHGEWFEPAPEIVALAAKVSLPDFPVIAPGAPEPVPGMTGQYGPHKPRTLLKQPQAGNGRFVSKYPPKIEPDPAPARMSLSQAFNIYNRSRVPPPLGWGELG